jgi:hypothetical protein
VERLGEVVASLGVETEAERVLSALERVLARSWR